VTRVLTNGGGWVPIVIHHVCNGCNPYAMSAADLDGLLAWIQANAALGIQVKTMSQVIAAPPPPPPPPPPVILGPVNPSLEGDTSPADGLADCWQHGQYGTNTVTYGRTADAHSGSAAEQITITSFTSGNRKLVTKQDTGACAPVATPGTTYTLSGWFKGSASRVLLVAYYRDAAGTWKWWAGGPPLAASAAWTRATFTTPAVPAGATHLSFGFALESAGSITMDDLAIATP
jgi:hypothetical protein